MKISISGRTFLPITRLLMNKTPTPITGCLPAMMLAPKRAMQNIKMLPTLMPIVGKNDLIHIYAMPVQLNREYCTQAGKPADTNMSTGTGTGMNDETTQQRIYYGSLATRMRIVKVFSLSTSLAGLAAQPILMEQGMKMGGTGMAVFLCGFAGFFTFITPLLLHFITKKYVTEIHYDPRTEEYTATTISLFLTKIETKFKASDVNVPEVPGMFTSFLVGQKALFVDPSMFDDPEHYIKMMGYDKPIDFMLEKPDAEEKPDIKDTKTAKTAKVHLESAIKFGKENQQPTMGKVTNVSAKEEYDRRKHTIGKQRQ